MSKVILFGCGRGADIAYRHLKNDSAHEVCGFTADAPYCLSDNFKGLPLVPFDKVTDRFPPGQFKMLVLLGFQDMNHLRAEKYLAAKEKGYSFISYLSSKVNSIEPLQLGENCFIMDGQCINLDVKIGNNVVMWSSNHIGDFSVIGDHAWLSSHVTIAGNVRIGEYAFFGINASITNNVQIAAETFVGASVLVAQDTIRGAVLINQGAKAIAGDSRTYMKVMDAAGKL